MAKRQISLWTDKEKSAFMDAYKVSPMPTASPASKVHEKEQTTEDLVLHILHQLACQNAQF